ncbi:MAG: hypothetical protein ACRD1Y_10580 [Terriglobales bacterium]
MNPQAPGAGGEITSRLFNGLEGLQNEAEVTQLRELACGFLEMALELIATVADEYSIRSATSRACYGVYHICRAWVRARGFPAPTNRKQLADRIGALRGAEAGERLRSFHSARCCADYQQSVFRPRFSGQFSHCKSGGGSRRLRAVACS